MKIVFVSRWFSDKMGYIENGLPAALAKMGHDVHIVTSTAQVYATHPFYNVTYKKFLGDPFLPEGTYELRGVKIHRLPFFKFKSQFIIRGLLRRIIKISPDVVQVFEHGGGDSVRISILSIFKKFKLFSGNHIVYSVFPQVENWSQKSTIEKLKVRLLFSIPGYFISIFSQNCFCVTSDSGEIASKYLSVPQKKVIVSTLGTDTSLYHPAQTEAENQRKKQLRSNLQITEDSVVCVYTGRLTSQKNPLITADAIQSLNQKGYNLTYLIIGEGEQEHELEKFDFVRRIDLQPYHALPGYYQLADIAVWPGEESTSQLDAVASGCNLILTNKIQAYSLTTEINSEKPQIVSAFFENDQMASLASAIETLMNENLRVNLATVALNNIRKLNSWEAKAIERLAIYNE